MGLLCIRSRDDISRWLDKRQVVEIQVLVETGAVRHTLLRTGRSNIAVLYKIACSFVLLVDEGCVVAQQA
jgi:hypothetical protein